MPKCRTGACPLIPMGPKFTQTFFLWKNNLHILKLLLEGCFLHNLGSWEGIMSL